MHVMSLKIILREREMEREINYNNEFRFHLFLDFRFHLSSILIHFPQFVLIILRIIIYSQLKKNFNSGTKEFSNALIEVILLILKTKVEFFLIFSNIKKFTE